MAVLVVGKIYGRRRVADGCSWNRLPEKAIEIGGVNMGDLIIHKQSW